MRAIVLKDFDSGPSLAELGKPEPVPGEVLIHVLGSSVNALDVGIAEGRMRQSMTYEFPLVLGRDFAGVVEAVGADVTQFQQGDEVFGFVGLPWLRGSWADYITLPADGLVALKPKTLDFAQAGALPLAGLTGLLAVDAVDPGEGDWMLVVGATGGVGSYAIQFGAQRGAMVIATAKPGEQDYVRGLGAAETVDYVSEDVATVVHERHPGGIQGLIDLINRTPEGFAGLAGLVADGGGVASSLGGANVEELAKRDVRATNLASSAADPVLLRRIAALVDEGKLKPPIAHAYPLEETPRALRDFQEGTLGKLSISLE